MIGLRQIREAMSLVSSICWYGAVLFSILLFDLLLCKQCSVYSDADDRSLANKEQCYLCLSYGSVCWYGSVLFSVMIFSLLLCKQVNSVYSDADDRYLANKRQCHLSALFCLSPSGLCHRPLECQNLDSAQSAMKGFNIARYEGCHTWHQSLISEWYGIWCYRYIHTV